MQERKRDTDMENRLTGTAGKAKCGSNFESSVGVHTPPARCPTGCPQWMADRADSQREAAHSGGPIEPTASRKLPTVDGR